MQSRKTELLVLSAARQRNHIRLAFRHHQRSIRRLCMLTTRGMIREFMRAVRSTAPMLHRLPEGEMRVRGLGPGRPGSISFASAEAVERALIQMCGKG